ncbi:MAG: NUDIX hydrolase [Actinomycetota bacterium]|nr:NUDIX hydrolase [Actinomycetota bacterium]
MQQGGVESTAVGDPDVTDFEVFAAGGVVWRPAPQPPEDAAPDDAAADDAAPGDHHPGGGAGRGVEVLTIHRPKRADWSLPKGKREPGESDEECAVREVEEETGLRCALGPELLATRYIDMRGRRKLVRYWAMTVEGGELTPNEEADRFRWVPVEDAYRRLTYPHDVEVVHSLFAHLDT